MGNFNSITASRPRMYLLMETPQSMFKVGSTSIITDGTRFWRSSEPDKIMTLNNVVFGYMMLDLTCMINALLQREKFYTAMIAELSPYLLGEDDTTSLLKEKKNVILITGRML